MRYGKAFEIPANTAESDPLEEVLELCFGRIKGVFILHPPGSIGLAHLQIFRHTRQIFPSTPGESFVGNKTTRDFPENWPIYELPHAVTLRGWNLDDTYDHTIYVELSVLQPEILVPTIIQSPALPGG